MRTKHFILVVTFLLPCFLFAQKETSIWYFGQRVGLDFNSGTPVPLYDGWIYTTEGVASMCSNTGSLLFYTDGVTVFNKEHVAMPNGDSLQGDPSATQSAVVVPFINDPLRYYIFTVGAGGSRLHYSVVNMALDNGKGDVELKNTFLRNNVSEKITAVKHCNGKDIWVICHGWFFSNDYIAYLISNTGVSAAPVISSAGLQVGSEADASMGCLKASPDGHKLAAAYYLNGLELLDFNNATGIVSNPVTLLDNNGYYNAYGVEFSPDSKLLYCSGKYTDPFTNDPINFVHQFNVALGSAASITASRVNIFTDNQWTPYVGTLQMAPDGKMYMANNLRNYLSVINYPSIAGTGCQFNQLGVQFTGESFNLSRYGLPAFIQSYWQPEFKAAGACSGLSIQFEYSRTLSSDSIRWNFGDPASGTANSSSLDSPQHIFSSPGLYDVQLISYTHCGADTMKQKIQAGGVYVNLGADTSLCTNNSFLLNPGTPGNNTYIWQDGTTGSVFNANTSGLYWVEVKNELGCLKRDSINLTLKPYPVFTLGEDKAICMADTITLTCPLSTASHYLWNTNAAMQQIKAYQQGLYWCEATKEGCAYRDSILVNIKTLPIVDLGSDTTLCEGIALHLNALNDNSQYTWQDNSTSSTYIVTSQGQYSVVVNQNGCAAKDTVTVNYTLKPDFSFGSDQLICLGQPVILKPVVDASWQLLWQDGSTGPTYTVTNKGLYSLSATNACGSMRDEIFFTEGICNIYIPTAFSPTSSIGANRIFRVVGTGLITQFHLQVFNRYGQLVFETIDKTKGWDGMYKSQPAAAGGYVYLLQYKDTNRTQSLRGSFLLIR